MRPAVVLVSVMLIAACSTTPSAPTVQIMPGKGKSTEVFAADNAICKQYANGEVQGGSQLINNAQVLTGIGATLLGAGVGAAFGGGRGAAIGAALGAASGAGYGGVNTAEAQDDLQKRYDMSYASCQQTRGNWIPAMSVNQ